MVNIEDRPQLWWERLVLFFLRTRSYVVLQEVEGENHWLRITFKVFLGRSYLVSAVRFYPVKRDHLTIIK